MTGAIMISGIPFLRFSPIYTGISSFTWRSSAYPSVLCFGVGDILSLEPLMLISAEGLVTIPLPELQRHTRVRNI